MNNHSFDGIIQSYLALHPFATHNVIIVVITIILLTALMLSTIILFACGRLIFGSTCLFFVVLFAGFLIVADDYFPCRISNWAFPSATKTYNAKLLKENMKLLQGCHSGQCLIFMSAKEEHAFSYLPDLETGNFVSSFMVKENGDFQGYRYLEGHDVLNISQIVSTYYYTHILSVNMRNGHGVLFVEVANIGETEKGIYEVPIFKFLHDVRNGTNFSPRATEQTQQSIKSQIRSDFQNSVSN